MLPAGSPSFQAVSLRFSPTAGTANAKTAGTRGDGNSAPGTGEVKTAGTGPGNGPGAEGATAPEAAEEGMSEALRSMHGEPPKHAD